MTENKEEKPKPEAASFSAHVFQLATASLVYMGQAKLPGADKIEVNLPLAKLTIDTLDMLKTKTEGKNILCTNDIYFFIETSLICIN